MTESSTFQGVFLTRLHRSNIEYMITGGVAATIYGLPRFTQDIDLVLRIDPDPGALHDAFSADRFYAPPVEVLEEALTNGWEGPFTLKDRETNLEADLYLLNEDPLIQWAFSRRVSAELEEVPFWLAPPEYVILKKVEYHRISNQERHARDIGAILEESADLVDVGVLKRWLDQLDLREHWNTLQESEGWPVL